MTMFDDLLGDEDDIGGEPVVPVRRGPGRPRKHESDRAPRPSRAMRPRQELEALLASKRPVNDSLGDVLSGVSMRWLQAVFGAERKTVLRAVQGLKPVKFVTQTPHYSVRDVAPFLVKPKMRIEEYLESISPENLPEHLRETYWNVQAKSQKVRLAAGDLWRTTDVIEVLGELFQEIKNTIMLWTDTVEEQTGTLTDEQRNLIITLTDDLQQNIHKTVVERATKGATRNQLKEFEPETVIEESDEEEDNYEDI